MPIYLIETKGEDTKRLVKADSAAGAIRHCASSLFTATTIASVEQASEYFAEGVKLEKAGETPADPPKGGDPHVNLKTGLVETPNGDAVDERPATIDELAAADPGATWRVDPKGGLVQRLPAGGDSETGWDDIREATAEELEAVQAAERKPGKTTK